MRRGAREAGREAGREGARTERRTKSRGSYGHGGLQCMWTICSKQTEQCATGSSGPPPCESSVIWQTRGSLVPHVRRSWR